jgi:hypothetical protein
MAPGRPRGHSVEATRAMTAEIATMIHAATTCCSGACVGKFMSIPICAASLDPMRRREPSGESAAMRVKWLTGAMSGWAAGAEAG